MPIIYVQMNILISSPTTSLPTTEFYVELVIILPILNDDDMTYTD